jgi:hypothetical protein
VRILRLDDEPGHRDAVDHDDTGTRLCVGH